MTQTNDNFSDRRRTGKLGILLLLTAAILLMGGQALRPWPAAGLLPETQTLWERHRERILAPGGLVHHFAFLRDESLASMGQDEMSLWKSLSLPADASVQNFKFVSGRWPGKYAIQMDRSPLELAPPQFEKSFTVQLWFRHRGPGLNPGPNSDTDATILALGDGVWSGFRFWIDYPQNILMFNVGQPKTVPAVTLVAFSRLCPDTWHHVAATWDGKTLSLFVDGLLSDRTSWAGEFHNARRTSKLRIGFTGNGLGSTIQDVDELAVYKTCLSEDQILTSALSGASVSREEISQLTSAVRNAWETPPQGLASLGELSSNEKLSSEVRAAASLRLSELSRLNSPETSAEFLAAVRDASLQIGEKSVLFKSLERTAAHDSICLLTSDNIAKCYLPPERNRSVPSLDPNSITSLCVEYDQALEKFRSEIARGDLAEWMTEYDQTHRSFLKQHCHSCHNASDASGGLNIESLSAGHPGSMALDELERIVDVLQDGTMPPKGHPVPENRSVRAFTTWYEGRPRFALCEELATDETQRWHEGYIHSRRFTRLEYRNAVRDLLGVQLDLVDLPAQDGFGGEGFDNVGDMLFTSTSQIEDYLHSTSVALSEARRNNCRWFPDTSGSSPPDLLSAESLSAFCRAAWRRPVPVDELNRLQMLVESARSRGMDNDQCINLVYQSILMSPNFLFIVEPAPETQGIYRLSPHEMATRLSLFIWSSIPDEELLRLADSGQILNSTVIEQQIARMLRDPRASALGEAFGLQWLGLLEDTRTPDRQVFPDFDEELAESMREEVVRYLTEIFSKDRPVIDLLDSDWTVINARLARHYELPDVPSGWHEVPLHDHHRGGVLTMGAVLTRTSYSHRTSPVLRGQWVLNTMLGKSVPPPPPNVPSLDSSSVDGDSATLRVRLERHRRDPACAGCHNQMDPLGFALENFDAIGRWRAEENGRPVESSVTLLDGTQLRDASDLKRMLNEQRDDFLNNFIRKLLGFAVGRGLSSFDDCVVERCVEQLRENSFRSHVLIREICLSKPFQYRYSPREASDAANKIPAGDVR
ncbi:MAG: DUF1592 domain-containing protein [Planctomycetaceae bacterium]|nr:DUF1592 domain-containing protein [Planctomycetaceae bacterium]